VTARFHLDALSPKETVHYVRHRLSVAGLDRPLPFDRDALLRIHALSRGVPRRINLLCDRALLGAYASGKSRVDVEIVEKAAAEVFGKDERAAKRRTGLRRAAVFGVGAAAGAVLFGVASLAVEHLRKPATSPAAAAPASAVVAAAASAPPARAASAASAASARPTVAAAASAPLALAPADLKTRFTTLHRDEKEAWRELAQSIWNVSLPAGDPCQLAKAQQLQCFRSGAFTLAVLRQLGRPGIVTLYDDQQRPVHAVLAGITLQGVALRMGGSTQTITPASLERLWRGDFATFWRTPPGYGSDAEALSSWLAEHLAKVRGEAGERELGEAALKAQVQTFQTTQGLKPDGVVGPLTLMQLNRASGVDEPRLPAESP